MKSILFIILILINCANGATVHVTNEPQPLVYSTIQSGINVAQPGDTITVAPGIYLENLILSKNLEIVGTGPGVIVDGRDLAAVFRIGNYEVLLRNLTIQNGSAQKGAGVDNIGQTVIENCIVRNNTVTGWGGGVSSFATGNLEVLNSTLEYNYAGEYGGGLASDTTVLIQGSIIRQNNATWGGGIYADGNFDILNSIISGNYAHQFGGGILSDLYLNISGSEISDNSVTVYGGGGIANYGDMVNSETGQVDYNYSHPIYYRPAILNISNSEIFGNVANDYGGGMASDSIIQSSQNVITGNRANKGAGIWSAYRLESTGDQIRANNASFSAGGIYNDEIAILKNTFVADNRAGQYGGGIHNYGELFLQGSTNITNNTAILKNGGGLYSYAGNVSISNSVRIRGNRASTPVTESNWAHGWNVYYYLSPWFDPATVVGGGIKI